MLTSYAFFFFLHVQNVIYSCDGKAEFSVSLLQSLVSHDPSEINLPIWCPWNASYHYQS